MSQGFFCPHCQLRNEEDAEVCVHCGFKFDGFKRPSFTTVNVGHMTQPSSPPQNRCEKYAPQLEKQALAIFVMDEAEPILLHDVTEIILGRESLGLQEQDLNLASYGPLELGISRRHAQINWEDGSFWLEDLRSTNGTWLNQERIAAGKAYKLKPSDNIWIGPLKLMVCFAPNEETEETPE